MQDLLLVLELSPLGVAMRSSLWLYPTANTVHLLAAATAFGAMLVADLRLLGLAGPALPAPPLFRLAIRLAITAAAIGVATGTLLFAADPQGHRRQPLLQSKAAPAPRPPRQRPPLPPPPPGHPPTRSAAAISLTAWTGTLICGRLIAYW